MTRRTRRALAWALATSTLLAAAPAGAQTDLPGKRDFDSRSGAPVRSAAPTDPAAIAARNRLNAQLGRQGVVDVDERTGTPRMIGRLDGFLTGPSEDDAAAIALAYVRDQRAVFGLSEDDLGALRLARRYTDVHGVTHLLWAQTWRGIAAWDNDLRAAVAPDGRLINVGGSPVPGLGSRTDEPDLSATEALGEALGDAGARGLAPRVTGRSGADDRTRFSGGHSARLVLFTERRGDVHLAWHVSARPGPAAAYDHLIDARSGDVLARHNRVEALAANVRVFGNAPGRGPQSDHPVEVTDNNDLAGPNARVFRNPDGDDLADNGAIAGPWNDTFADFSPGNFRSWNPTVPNSWQTNERQNAANVYYFVNTFHDWLEAEVGFAGFEGVDRVLARVSEGADMDGSGLPDDRHQNNAYMVTGPEGTSPTMGMFLWGNGRNGGDDATVVFHEYAHGLSSRLVTYASGNSALNSVQSAAMGEGWSDWYALDYLEHKGLEADDAGTDGELAVGEYVEDWPTGVRRAAIDCPVPSPHANCDGERDTYGDFTGDDEHANGEIWSQTLWQLRDALGGTYARDLVTEAMRLSPDDPSFLDMRNAILQADVALPGPDNTAAIWGVFAERGMGFTAFTSGGEDRTPAQSFVDPTTASPVTVAGKVTDAATGAPIPNALVEFPSVPGVGAGMTNASGNYAISGLFAGVYPEVAVSAPGREIVIRSVTLGGGVGVVNHRLRRNVAAASAGARVVSFTGPDYTDDGCGPRHLIDGARQTGWGSTAPNNPGAPGAKSVTIALRQPTDITAFRVDPGAVCGDDETASTRGYRIHVSTDGKTFAQARSGSFSAASNHRLNELAAGHRAVRFVRFIADSTQSTRGSGSFYMDAAELEVIGTPTAPVVTPKPKPPVVDVAAPVGRLSLLARQRIRAALRRGLKVRLDCDEACAGTFIATLDAKTAKRTKLLKRSSRRKSLKIASGRVELGAGGRTVTLRFSRKARRRLKAQKRLKLKLVGTVRDGAGNDARAARSVTLRR